MGAPAAGVLMGQAGASSYTPTIERPHEPVPASAQFHTFSALLEDFQPNADLVRECATVGLDANEPYYIVGTGAVLQAHQDTGVYTSSAHVNSEAVESNARSVGDTYEPFAHDGRKPALVDLGIDDGLNIEAVVRSNGHHVNAAMSAMAEHGFEFGCHNGSHRFQHPVESNDRSLSSRTVENDVHARWIY